GPPPLPDGTGAAQREARRPMQANNPHADDNLSELERRLAGWQPTAARLDPDALLFAAGRASVPPPRPAPVWPAVAWALTRPPLGLGGWLAFERGERLTLAAELRGRPPIETPVAGETNAATADEPSLADYLVVRDLVTKKGLDALPDLAAPQPNGPPGT